MDARGRATIAREHSCPAWLPCPLQLGDINLVKVTLEESRGWPPLTVKNARVVQSRVTTYLPPYLPK